MTNLINYTLPGNITSFSGAINYTTGIFQTATNTPSTTPFYGPIILLMTFLGFLAVSVKYGGERAMIYTFFMTTIAATLLASGGILDPVFIVFPLVLLATSLYALAIQ